MTHISDLAPELIQHILSYLSNKALVEAMCAAPRLFVIPLVHLKRRQWAATGVCVLAQCGDAKGIQYKMSHPINKFLTNDYVLSRAMYIACENGHLPVVEYLHSINTYCNSLAVDLACKNGHLPVVAYLHTHRPQLPCTTAALDWASGKGHLAVLQYLHRVMGATLPASHREAMDDAIRKGHLAVVQYLHEEMGAACSPRGLDYACNQGENMAMLHYLHRIGVGYSNHAMDHASAHGYLTAVQFLHSIGGDCNPYAFNGACLNGHLEMVQYLHRIGKTCAHQAMDWACEKGHLPVVQFLHSINAPYTSHAVCFGKRETVQYLRDHYWKLGNYQLISGDSVYWTLPDRIIHSF